MRRSWKWMPVVALSLTMVALGGCAGGGGNEVAGNAPTVSGMSVDGKQVSLADYRGKSVVLLNFFASY